jgi:DNA-directed RNA polymerase subunit RPC12/RpoP
MEEDKHTYRTSHYIELSCYYCRNKWRVKGVHHIYTCTSCGKEAEAIPQL